MKARISDLVVDLKYGYKGIVVNTYHNWDNLKALSSFETFDPDKEALKSSVLDLLIHGDPRDEWLKQQEIPFTDDQLEEEWYCIKCFDGGVIWSCESTITLMNFILN